MKTPFKPGDLVENIYTGEVEMIRRIKKLSILTTLYFVNKHNKSGWDFAHNYRLLSPKEVLINLDVKPKK